MFVEANIFLVIILRAIQASGLAGSHLLNKTVSAFFGISCWSTNFVGFTATFLALFLTFKCRLPQLFWDTLASLRSGAVSNSPLQPKDLGLIIGSKAALIGCSAILHGTAFSGSVNTQFRVLDGLVAVLVVLGASKMPNLGYQPAKAKTGIVIFTSVTMTLVWLKSGFPFSVTYLFCIPVMVASQTAHYLIFHQYANCHGISKWELTSVVCVGLAALLLPISAFVSSLDMREFIGPLSKLSAPLNRYMSIGLLLLPVEVNLIEYWSMATCSPDLYAMMSLFTSLQSFVASNWLAEKLPLHSIVGQWLCVSAFLVYLYMKLREWMIVRKNTRVAVASAKASAGDINNIV